MSSGILYLVPVALCFQCQLVSILLYMFLSLDVMSQPLRIRLCNRDYIHHKYSSILTKHATYLSPSVSIRRAISWYFPIKCKLQWKVVFLAQVIKKEVCYFYTVYLERHAPNTSNTNIEHSFVNLELLLIYMVNFLSIFNLVEIQEWSIIFRHFFFHYLLNNLVYFLYLSYIFNDFCNPLMDVSIHIKYTLDYIKVQIQLQVS